MPGTIQVLCYDMKFYEIGGCFKNYVPSLLRQISVDSLLKALPESFLLPVLDLNCNNQLTFTIETTSVSFFINIDLYKILTP